MTLTLSARGVAKILDAVGRTHARPSPDDEVFHFLTIGFNVSIALALTAGREPTCVADPANINAMIALDTEYAMSDAVDADKPGLAVVLPNNMGTLVIDGHHRAHKAQQLGRATFPLIALSPIESEAVCYTRDVWKILLKPPKPRRP